MDFNKTINACDSAPRLLVCFKSKPKQYTYDYLMQIASANGLLGIRHLCLIYNLKPNELARFSEDEIYDLISGSLTNESISHLKSRPINLKVNLYSSVRICPVCISEDFPVPESSNHPFSFVCTQHGEILHDKCPLCSFGFMNIRSKKNNCSRGCRLSPNLFQKIDGDFITIQKRLSPWKFWEIAPDFSKSFENLERFLCRTFKSICKSDNYRPEKMREYIQPADIEAFISNLSEENLCFLNGVERLYEKEFRHERSLSESRSSNLIEEISVIFRTTRKPH